VQEPTIEYLAERLVAVRRVPTEFFTWKYAVESLQENLRETARKISERLEGQDSGVKLFVQSDAVTEQSWRDAQSGTTDIVHIQGKRQGAAIFAWLSTRPPGEYEYPWLGPTVPLIYLRVRDEPANAPERFTLAVPHEHRFHAAYATRASREALGYPLGKSSEPRDTPPPGVTLKKDVSALQIATDIWTYLIENFLSG
jgi:hypothetical protein